MRNNYIGYIVHEVECRETTQRPWFRRFCANHCPIQTARLHYFDILLCAKRQPTRTEC